MLNMSLGEILIIGLVALMVLGPEQLPTTARIIGRWVGRCKNALSKVKSEFIQEMSLKDNKKRPSDTKNG